MDTLAFTAGIGVMDKNRFPDGFEIIHQDMMNNPIPEISGKDFPQFRFFRKKADRTKAGYRSHFLCDKLKGLKALKCLCLLAEPNKKQLLFKIITQLHEMRCLVTAGICPDYK